MSFHQQGIPLLVSAKLLRERGLGQIDLARVEKKEQRFLIHVGEVKSSRMGEAALLKTQRRRILNSLQFLCQTLGHSGKMSVLVNLD